MERQKQLVANYAREKGYGEIQIFSDVDSGLNENRNGFLKLLNMVSEGKASKVIVAYEDRLARFGFETLMRLFSAFGTEIEVINREERSPNEELVGDLVTIVSKIAKKLYGVKSHKCDILLTPQRLPASMTGSIPDHSQRSPSYEKYVALISASTHFLWALKFYSFPQIPNFIIRDFLLHCFILGISAIYRHTRIVALLVYQ